MNNEKYLKILIKNYKKDVEINKNRYKNRYNESLKILLSFLLVSLFFMLVNINFGFATIFAGVFISLANLLQNSKINEKNEVLFSKIEYVNNELKKCKTITLTNEDKKSINKNLYLIEQYKVYKERIIKFYEKGNMNSCLDEIGINDENKGFINELVDNDIKIKKLQIRK